MTHLPQFRLLALGIGAIALLGLGLNLSDLNTGVPAYVSIIGLILAAAVALPFAIGAFLRFFIVFYGLGYIGLMVMFLISPLLPQAISGYLPPPLTGFTAAAFGLLALGMARLPVTSAIFTITDPYFETQDRGTITVWPFAGITMPERWIAYILLGIIIAINLGQVGLIIRHNQFNREFYDALQNKNEAEFWRQLFLIWAPIVAALILSNIVEYILVGALKIRWRAWLTSRLMGRWLDQGTHYRLQFSGGIDNPDQRIQEDVNKYVLTTYSLTIQMISQISTLVSFSVILWGLSASLPFPSEEFKIPGFLFWIALLYAAIGTAFTHLIGRRLISLNFAQEKYEANFRYMLARLREFGEPVALLKGETAEKNSLENRLTLVVANYMSIIGVGKWLNAFTSLYGYANSIIPLVITAPFFFIGKVTLGAMMQTASAFSRVDAALSFFIDRYATLADFKAVVDRLNNFNTSIDAAVERRKTSEIIRNEAERADIAVPALRLGLPNGKTIATISDLAFTKGARTLLVGPSGSGKSTLFRAIAGIWPFGTGEITVPSGQSVMLLPQRPYIPIGTLRGAISYPALEGAHSDDAIYAALDHVHLPQLKDRLGEDTNWSQTLSGGEQQRLAVARALLAKPDWLFLDEATSALDEPLEAAIYAAIRTVLPGTSVVSIGHRSSLINAHDRRIGMQMCADGLFSVVDQPVTSG